MDLKIIKALLLAALVVIVSCLWFNPEGQVKIPEEPTEAPEMQCENDTGSANFEGDTKDLPYTSNKYIDVSLQRTIIIDDKEENTHIFLKEGYITSDLPLTFVKQIRVYVPSGKRIAWATRDDQIECDALEEGCFSRNAVEFELATKGDLDLYDELDNENQLILDVKLLVKSPPEDATIFSNVVFKFFDCT